MNETVRFLLIVGSIYVCHVANSYLAETLYTSPPHKIDVRWIGLIFEGVWSIIFAEVYRMVSKAYDGYGAKKKTEGGVEDSAKDGARGEPAPSNSNSVNVSGVVEHTTSKTTRKTLRVHEFSTLLRIRIRS